MVVDAILQNMSVFMATQPEGAELPNTGGTLGGNIISLLLLTIWAILTALGPLSMRTYVPANWFLVVAAPAVALLVAVAWRTTVGSVSVVIYIGVGMGTAIALLNGVAQERRDYVHAARACRRPSASCETSEHR